jgi:multiple sugar transport system permease protein
MTNIKKWIIYFLLILGMIAVLGPFVYMFLTSLSQDNYSLPSPYRLMFDTKSFNNYADAWSKNHFQRYFVNSLTISLITMLFSISLAALTAYAFARFTFPLKEFLFKAFIFTLFVPSLLNIIPQFTIIKALGLVNTYPGLILVYVGTGVVFSTFFLRGFFERIPVELEESIVMDGGGRMTIFRAIYLPLSLPALGTLAIMSFSGTWDEFAVALTFLKAEALRTLPIALQLFKGQYATLYGLFFAASIIALIPIMIIFLVFQKQLVNPGQSDGGVKG